MAWTNVKGFNFRGRLSTVVEGTNEIGVYNSANDTIGPAYGATASIDGDTVTYGYTPDPGTGTDGGRNHDDAADRRFAGVHFRENTNATRLKFRVDVPSGTYNIGLAFGDAASNVSRNWWRILDNTTERSAHDETGTEVAVDDWMDATGVTHSTKAAWVSSNTTVQCNISSGILILEFGGGNSSTSTAANTNLAHLSIVSAGASAVTLMGQAIYILP